MGCYIKHLPHVDIQSSLVSVPEAARYILQKREGWVILFAGIKIQLAIKCIIFIIIHVLCYKTDCCFIMYFSLFEDHCLHHGHRYFSSLSNILHQACKTGDQDPRIRGLGDLNLHNVTQVGQEQSMLSALCPSFFFCHKPRYFIKTLTLTLWSLTLDSESCGKKHNMAPCTTTLQSCGLCWSDQELYF